MVANTEDPEYKAQYKEYQEVLGYAILAAGLDMPIEDKDGNKVEKPSEIARIMKGKGFLPSQTMKIIDEVKNLTEFAEGEETSFLEED
jgi:hypothetical protein